MLEKAGAAVVGALMKVLLILGLIIVIGFAVGWMSNPAHKTQRDSTGNSIVNAGFSVVKHGADWVTKKTDDNPRT